MPGLKPGIFNSKETPDEEDEGLPLSGDELVRSAISAEPASAISESKRKPRVKPGEEVIGHSGLVSG